MVTNRDAATEIDIVEAWHDASNSSAIERLVRLSHPEVRIGGPYGIGYGTKLL